MELVVYISEIEGKNGETFGENSIIILTNCAVDVDSN